MRNFTFREVPPDGREAAQVIHGFGHGPDDRFRFLRRIFLIQAQPEGAVRHIVHPPDGQQHVAGIQGTGGAGAAGGGADTFLVQQQEQRFAFDALEAEIDIPGKPVCPVTVQGGMGNPANSVNNPVPQGGNLLLIFRMGRRALLQRRGHGDDPRRVFRAGPFAALLGAAFDQVRQRDALTGVEEADALGPVELVGRK